MEAAGERKPVGEAALQTYTVLYAQGEGQVGLAAGEKVQGERTTGRKAPMRRGKRGSSAHQKVHFFRGVWFWSRGGTGG